MFGRKKSENAIYAEEVGIVMLNGPRFIWRHGGAKKFRAMSPEARNLILKAAGVRDDRPAAVEDK